MQEMQQEPQIRSLGQEDPLGKKMATHSSILTWEIPWTEEPGGLESMGCKESNMIEAADTFTFQIRRWYHPNDRK